MILESKWKDKMTPVFLEDRLCLCQADGWMDGGVLTVNVAVVELAFLRLIHLFAKDGYGCGGFFS